MLGALITGVRRAFPYVPSEEVEALVERSGQQLFKIVHAAPFTVGVQVSVPGRKGVGARWAWARGLGKGQEPNGYPQPDLIHLSHSMHRCSPLLSLA